MVPRPRVFVTRQLPGSALGRLSGPVEVDVWSGSDPLDAVALAERARFAEGLLCLLSDAVDAPLIASCSALRVISSCSVGVDHVDLDAASARGIPVGHTPGVLVETTAELAFGLLLAASRRIVEADRYVRAGTWADERGWNPDLMVGRDLCGATLGIVGLGAIGRAVAARARGFGMRVLGWSRRNRGVEGVEFSPLDALLAASDFVSIHLALTPETRGLLGPEALARMPRGAILVNTSRGGIVDETALIEVLVSGHLAAAALDVFDSEPLDPASPLLAAPNLVLTPHIGSASLATRARMADLAVDNLLAGLEGRPLQHCANADEIESTS